DSSGLLKVDESQCLLLCDNEKFQIYMETHKEEPGYVVYDYDHNGTKKLIFVSWTPDTASVKKKTIYAASYEAIKSRFGGCKFFQAHDCDEVSNKCISEKL
ncbi:hypothetical protein, partial [Salmonella sp. s51933]|uniref:hypothetical protein n=1 Tax=Salmonella sp. s51933 TaxID=3160127 RepID=UPI003754CCEF